MAVTATRPHTDAVQAALSAAGLAVLPGGQGVPTAPCVVLWPAPGEPDGSSLGDVDDLLIVEFTTVACGSTTDQALWVADRITACLHRLVLSVPGRVLDPLRLVDTAPVQRDNTLSTSLQSTALRWRITSRPAG